MTKQIIKAVEVSGNGDGASDGAEAKQRKQSMKYPKYTLDQALAIPSAIKENYSGKPMPPKSLADACGASYSNADWRVKLAASAAYGLTEGSYSADTVSLTDRVGSIFMPRNPEEKCKAMREAAREPEPMRRVYDHFDNGIIPQGEFFTNTLVRDFGVPEDQLDKFVTVLRANARYAYATAIADAEEHKRDATGDDTTADATPEELVQEPQTLGPAHPDLAERVFISHSKNEDILDVLRTTMDIAGFEYEIAEDEETTALPVPDKVMASMKRCSAAIINVSVDEQEKRADGSYGINQNVLIEIGCAFALYGIQRCILLWDKRIEIPSNLQGLYRCQYEGDSLSAADLLKLQKSIASFRSAESS